MVNQYSLDLESSSSQYVYVADTAALSLNTSITIEAWVNFESLTGGEMTIAGKYRGGTNQRSYLFLWNDTGDNLQFFTSNNGTSVSSVSVAWTPTINTWYHLTAVFDIAAGSCAFYINGVQQGTTQTGLNTNIQDTTARFSIGAYNTEDSATGFWDGKIDEVRIYNATRTQSQITNDMLTRLNGNETNLVGYWAMENNLNDSTSNAANLTGVNSPTFSPVVPFSGTGGAFLFNII